MDADKRNSDRRFQGFTVETSDDETQKVKVKKFLPNKATTYTAEMIQSRWEWLAELTQTQLKHLAHFSEDAEDFKRKIECPIVSLMCPWGFLVPFELMVNTPEAFFSSLWQPPREHSLPLIPSVRTLSRDLGESPSKF